jgi:CBS domain-containing protein
MSAEAISTEAISTLHRTLGAYRKLVHLGPPVVRQGSSLIDVVDVLAADPRPGVVLVIDADEQLVGWILGERLEMDLTLLVLPDSVTNAPEDLEVHAARGIHQTAEELMTAPAIVTLHTTVKEALERMIQSHTHAAALVDDQKRLLGYVTLPEIMREMLTWGG